MANFLEQMESNIFDAQITRLARKTGKTPDKEFMRAMYYRVKERYKEELQKRKIVLRQLDAVRLDEIVSYVFYYHLFHTAHLPQPLVAQLEGDENYRGFLVRDVAVYMVINEHLNVEKLSNTSEYSPEIAAYNMACSYSLFVLGSFRGENRRMNGINNLFKKAMITIKSVISLLAGGNSCDAVILWRHLHELECVLLVLNNADDEMFFKYIKHMEYFNMEGSPNGEELQKRLSEECKQYGVKERNAFINYGWLLYVPGFKEEVGKEYRLNFKEGLQRLAGQGGRHPAYASASKILHPSAWVVTIRDDKFYKFTLFELYRSLTNIVEQIKLYVARYRESSIKASECDNYLKSIDGYMNIIVRNNKIIAVKYPD
ncbi:hypothetical protein ESZ91_10255 [Candidatus Borkfalkia ceftriaxoniphila]|uniref:Uncharacterized protein n=1 Tax=Candidatus Borkfalkia ceftriaxoniphila TaxID=2508949 RepID=A0A4Q2K7N6_9FIRM|nr:DUF5677 domain-containing protein [Candidatus Borkfalkia ceftriaxoniphila]RXZ58033.1 hypothetical protein ESZ91_10255 [Candidatus Borkfalkia ceftriaxoniphila]